MNGMKMCTKCKELKPLNAFNKHSASPDGYQPRCKVCRKEDAKIYRNTCINYKPNQLNSQLKYESSHPKRLWCSRTIRSHERNGFVVNITLNELDKYVESKDYCEFCGVKLDYGRKADGKIHSNSPALDRRNNEDVINLNNINILCYNCNSTKRTRTMDEFIMYCNMIVEKFKKERNYGH